jgi:chemotaxis protein CheD
MFSNVVGIADMKISDNGTLVTYGLGSCIGIAIFDERTKQSGLIHIMLPRRDYFSTVENPFKFADSGISLMVDELVKRGASRETMKAKIAGGATMCFGNNNKKDIFDIGNMNIDATFNILKKLDIDVVGQDIGGHYSRTIEFDINRSVLNVKRIYKEGVNLLEL